MANKYCVDDSGCQSAFAQRYQEPIWRDGFDSKRLAQDQQIVVAGHKEPRAAPQGTGQEGIVFGIAAAWFAERRRLNPPGFEAEPSKCACAVAGRKPWLEFDGDLLV